MSFGIVHKSAGGPIWTIGTYSRGMEVRPDKSAGGPFKMTVTSAGVV